MNEERVRKEKPFAVCTRCGRFTRDANLMGEDCKEICTGTWRSEVGDVWKRCRECDGYGCDECGNEGWLFDKSHRPELNRS